MKDTEKTNVTIISYLDEWKQPIIIDYIERRYEKRKLDRAEKASLWLKREGNNFYYKIDSSGIDWQEIKIHIPIAQ